MFCYLGVTALEVVGPQGSLPRKRGINEKASFTGWPFRCLRSVAIAVRRPIGNVWRMSEIAEMGSILGARHAAAQEAYRRKDIASYQAMFSRDLVYRREDGSVVGRAALMKDVQDQFDRFGKVDSRFVRESLQIVDGNVAERLRQTATAETSAFGLVHRRWRMMRRGRYTWSLTDGVWTITSVKVHAEETRPDGWRFGL